MNYKLTTRLNMRLTLLASGLVLSANTGCSLSNAVTDGFFGGISNRISSLLTSLLLAGVGV